MNTQTKRILDRIELYSKLKDVGALSPSTMRLLLSTQHKNNPSAEYEILNQVIELSKYGKSPFEFPDENVRGQIQFGVSENNIPIGFNINELHSLIVGAPGTGKTIMMIFLMGLQAIQQGIKCWFFVKAQDVEKLIKIYKDILVEDFSGQIKLNLLNPPPNYDKFGWKSFLWDIFG